MEENLPLPPAHFKGTVKDLRRIADTLEKMDEDGSSFGHSCYLSLSCDTYMEGRPNPKTAAAAFARAFAPCLKDGDPYSFKLVPEGYTCTFQFSTLRSNVCTKVTKLVETEVWECPPLLTPDEEAAIGLTPDQDDGPSFEDGPATYADKHG